MSTPSDRPNNPTTALWNECIAGWENIIRAFGHPIELVRWGWMRALEHRALGHWLRDLEAIVRKAILSDALTREVPALKPRAPGTRKRCAQPSSQEEMPRFRRTYSFDPTTWKVSFRMLTRTAPDRNVRRSPRKTREPAERRRCQPFAYRIEALRRAIKYREDYVVRHVRRLARLATANRAASVHASSDPFASKPVRALISYLPDAIATAIERILWSPKFVEPG
ncbi:MAG TPA: hypothetical protein VGO52_04225 [Hyphomonadaceae bacterium]|jgi:hypothetical protein|nr:hypothetical protein [Hyphomonadaceae bacterium]